MNRKELHIISSLLERTENLPDIIHLRAAPYNYKLTEKEKELLFDTYQKLDDILKEVAAFINVKFPVGLDVRWMLVRICNPDLRAWDLQSQ